MASEDYVRRMSDALRSGAKMLAEICPVCNSPLFEVDNELRCIRCDKPVVRVHEETEVLAASTPLVLSKLENALSSKIDLLTSLLQKSADPDEIRILSEALASLVKLFHESRRLAETLKKK
ncbi:MAG: hypothetical protein NZ570_05495 [Candidatus Caldarchaeum sp.]|nr:hypothetical protein [Candidatus Caldarchaeum sp.]MCS7137613.1 hypothetical protein [Candidatus Caldarchaeum sp.]MDW7978697.1 Sjogren's syndrome/scleroderma autoantigen 1 family protein [Candidatus Caldarchaeum sp.]MDW8359169.1 Sjogren's syndrome/scleroderma autoantigen 1 family protein [Candidatus Caldarchaeum sp.]